MSNKNIKNLDVNPCKMCMPMGASIAFKGIENSVAMIHGSQGCSTYIRRHMATHYNEPVDIASSSLNEKQTVYGGVDNLKKGLKNVIRIYNPKVIGIATSCLAETIGEDINRIVKEFAEEENIKDTVFVPVTTPGYGGTQYEGYFLALRRVLEVLTEECEKHNKINIVAANISPGDMRRIRDMLESMDVGFTLFPDTGKSLDGGFTKEYTKISSEGTKIEDIKKMGGAVATIEMGMLLSEKNSPGKFLENEYDVPLYKCPVPIGLENTDEFLSLIEKVSGKKMTKRLVEDRERMLDGMIDSHKYNGEGRAAIFGEPEIVYSITKLCIENGIFPAVVATGAKVSGLNDLLRIAGKQFREKSIVMDDADFDKIKEKVILMGANILIGHSDGKFITEDEGIPLVRVGFPIHDQIGGQRKVTVGYDGSMNFIDQITNALLDEKHRVYRKKMYNSYYIGRG
ncbi:nitrogenase molybdenum-iron protein NifN [Dethiosulfatibacter aminovorans DSM 17477]|uniref:Nitrogenase molybdenum-iron protein NifN n=1 Tax=Dethiosulfatibacter aminovorans DSM 17477 TaxID=1121476 RepID=A0A1M6CCY0_9FIRM|nr:nitrogenase component 1 [Dethiosulfatibacter aminovorans]SHI58856.1 nitrogenase molybdenum-iron protein NifN [Dethiosulfatibacter aminovorans DSM 17477]